MHPKHILNLRSLLGRDAATPAGECAVGRPGTGIEPPPVVEGVPAVHLERSFAFIDICGFTAYVDRYGEHEAIELLTRFRGAVRDISARRGVRVGKWLGDGVMLVSTEEPVTVAAAAEMLCRFHGTGIDIHSGLAAGPVLLFEGDDYIGRPANLAARLCEIAAPGEILAAIDPELLPEWVEPVGEITVEVPGIGPVPSVQRLTVTSEVLARFSDRAA